MNPHFSLGIDKWIFVITEKILSTIYTNVNNYRFINDYLVGIFIRKANIFESVHSLGQI